MKDQKWLRTDLALLVVVFFFIYLIPLPATPLSIPDETRYAEIPREMLETGDWVVPRLNGLDYFEKPVFGYWVTATSLALFGENELAVRLPAALFAFATALLLFFFGRWNASRDGALAAFVYLCLPLVIILGRLSLVDGILNFFTTATVMALYVALETDSGSRRRWFLLACGVACGGAFLTKGFLALVVPCLILGPYLLWDGKLRRALAQVPIPALSALVVTLPWCILVHLRAADFWHHFFWVEHIQRFFHPEKAQHPEPVWYYLPFLIAGSLPWLFFLPSLISGWRKRQRGSLEKLLTCWILFPLVFFSVSTGKLGPYILPVFPALALLFSSSSCRSRELRRRLSMPGSLLALACFLGAGLFLFYGNTTIFHADEQDRLRAVVTSLVIWGLALSAAPYAKSLTNHTIAIAASPLLFFFVLTFNLPGALIERKAPGAFLEASLADITEDTLLITSGATVRAVCWYFKRNDVHIYDQKDELAYGLQTEEGRSLYIGYNELKATILAAGKTQDVVLFLPIKYKNRDLFPEPDSRRENARFMIMSYAKEEPGKNASKTSGPVPHPQERRPDHTNTPTYLIQANADLSGLCIQNI